MLNKSHSEIVCKLIKTCKLVVSVLMKSELDSSTVNGMKRICVREREWLLSHAAFCDCLFCERVFVNKVCQFN